ncbi:HlyIII-domain-containing protein [Linderina pennispora]|uniref:HlyIII-domain-containing protein n=1 Tax=Linderina pennispora TaxID=61395 RepID=A0A1Y1WAA0_9FUNG|nr:HlyIII-domain-containing protein [Linderina pennispora]ORX70453.1 HlyIII-domain-containing protein [Linderina pennispora]
MLQKALHYSFAGTDKTKLAPRPAGPRSRQSPKTIGWDDLPAWLRDNEYIRTGYRKPTGSHAKCVESLCHVHNETGNIFTHMLGALLFVYFIYSAPQTVFSEFDTIGKGERIAVYGYLLTATTCFASTPVRIYNKCDMLGILSNFVGSISVKIFYMFYCEPQIRTMHLTLLVCLCVMCFSAKEFRAWRSVAFILLGFEKLVPVFHTWWMFGAEYMWNAVNIPCMFWMAFFYIGGTAIYASRVPERWFPGKFDFWFGSHQIFHVMSVIAATIHYAGSGSCLSA